MVMMYSANADEGKSGKRLVVKSEWRVFEREEKGIWLVSMALV